MSSYLLTVGRAMGLDNLNKFQLLRKTAMSDKAGRFVGHFNFKAVDMDSFVSLDKTEAQEYKSLVNILKKIFPKSTSEKAETIVDVILQKFNMGKISEGTSSLTVDSVTKNGYETVGRSEFKLLNNPAGTIIDLSGKGEANSKYSMRMHLSRFENGGPSAADLIKSLKYEENGKTGNLTMQLDQRGMVKALSAKAEFPVEYFDTLSLLTSEGRYSNFTEALEVSKRIVGAENSIS